MPAEVRVLSQSPSRLAGVDGLRAIAVLGVLWWHSWLHTGNPALAVNFGDTAINLQRALAPLGNGFNLFFVLSGFCIRLSLGKLGPTIDLANLGRFWRQRWLRLTPAFLVVVAASFFATWHAEGVAPWKALIPHALWLYGYVPDTPVLAPLFWTLQVEWEFYLAVPLVLWLVPRAPQRWFAWIALGVLSLVWRWWVNLPSVAFAPAANVHLPAHALEFVWGLAIAEWRLLGPQTSALTFRPLSAICGGLLLVYIGRGLQSTEVTRFAGSLAPVTCALAEPVMTLGFAAWLVVALDSTTWFYRFLTADWLQTVGRWSYGLYLWHWWPSVTFGIWFRSKFGETLTAQYLALIATLSVSLPLAWATYRWLECPFINRSVKCGA